MKTVVNGSQPSAETLALVRQNVKSLLLQSEAYRSLPQEKQRALANQMVQIGSYLAEPQGIPGNKLRTASPGAASARDSDPYAFQMAQPATRSSQRPGARQEGQFVAQGAREGAAVAGALLQAVNFPEFVSGLIKGVFHAIVQSSIEQMEAYGRLVADVAKTLNQFRDENVSANQGRDHLVDQFPDLFQIDIDTGAEGGSGPRVRVRDGVDESEAVKKVNKLPIEGGAVSSLDDETIEEKLVPAARTQLATSRQQLLATMVMMGINRIVVTDGKIAAKVLYDFQARDNFKFQKSATQFDYGDQYAYTSEGQFEREGQGPEHRSSSDKDKRDSEYRGGSYYAKGEYKNTATPVLNLISATQESSDAALQTKASLAGSVEVNFKSDYFPLEKMADSFQISQIQDAAKPGRGAAAANAGAPATAQPPATQPAATPKA